MTEQSPGPRPAWDPRGWSTAKILLFLVVVATFVTMLTWDRGHFSSEPTSTIKQVK